MTSCPGCGEAEWVRSEDYRNRGARNRRFKCLGCGYKWEESIMADRVYLTCESCGEEFDVSMEEALQAKKDGYFICSECDAQDRIEGFPFTDDRGAFTAVMRW